jgi:hypothetical protein
MDALRSRDRWRQQKRRSRILRLRALYSTYFYELEQRGKRTSFSGRITEVFVFRKDPWVNPGWHMEPTTSSAADQ